MFSRLVLDGVVMSLFSLGVTVNLALGREGWQKVFHMLWMSTNFRPAGLA